MLKSGRGPMLTNKQLQDLLAEHPDDATVEIHLIDHDDVTQHWSPIYGLRVDDEHPLYGTAITISGDWTLDQARKNRTPQDDD